MLNPNTGTRETNIYVDKDNKNLCYEIKFKDIALNNGTILPGSMSSLCIYDEGKKAFILKEMSVSNSVLKDMLMEGTFEGEISIRKAEKDEFVNQLTQSLKAIA